MEKDIIYDENELSMAVNHIMNQVDFLSRCIEEYTELLRNLQRNGTQTEQICSALETLITEAEPYKTAICDVGESVRTEITKSMGGVETADDFRFPGDITSVVHSLLARFW